MSHTPEWWIEFNNVAVLDDKGAAVCMKPDDDYEGAKNWKANARLIAAAPELLEALQAFVDYHSTDYEDIPEMEQAHRIIAKAKGEDVPA
jgi:hypothetical protein